MRKEWDGRELYPELGEHQVISGQIFSQVEHSKKRKLCEILCKTASYTSSVLGYEHCWYQAANVLGCTNEHPWVLMRLLMYYTPGVKTVMLTNKRSIFTTSSQRDSPLTSRKPTGKFLCLLKRHLPVAHTKTNSDKATKKQCRRNNLVVQEWQQYLGYSKTLNTDIMVQKFLQWTAQRREKSLHCPGHDGFHSTKLFTSHKDTPQALDVPRPCLSELGADKSKGWLFVVNSQLQVHHQ